MRLLASNIEPLFQPPDLANLITQQERKAETCIEQFSDDDVLTVPIDDMVDAIYDDIHLPPLN
jgi:hypothetical protein